MPYEQLKPCPFCGCRILNRHRDDEWHLIQCAQCGCEKRNTAHWKLAGQWNTRAAPNVKSLVWKSGQALTSTGNYIVIQEDWDEEPFWFVLRNGKPDGRLGEHSTEEEAKAAAQADYERRILGALE